MSITLYPSESLRKKLIVAGIPASEHTVERLASNIPDFDTQLLQEMTPNSMARILLYFISKGLVTPRIPSRNALLNMPWGSHVCQFYNDKQDLLAMLVPYFKQGLERNEACVWLVSDLTVEEAKNALTAVVPKLDDLITSGQMTIAHYADFYTNDNGVVKPAEDLSRQFAALESTSCAKGFAGIRASGGVSWIHDEENMARFMQYETKVNCAIQSARIMAVCTYPARSASLCGCRELIHNHGKFFVQRGEWVHDNSRDAEKIEAVFASLTAQQLTSGHLAGSGTQSAQSI